MSAGSAQWVTSSLAGGAHSLTASYAGDVRNQLGHIDRIAISTTVAELVILRDVDGAKQTFLIYVMRGEDGIWRIESM